MRLDGFVNSWWSPPLFFKVKDLHLSELYRMALSLKRDVTFGHHLVPVFDELSNISVFFIKLRPLGLQHDLVVNEVFDAPVAVNFIGASGRKAQNSHGF